MANKRPIKSDKRLYVRSDNLVMRKIVDEYILVPITHIGADVQSVFNLNHSAAAIWESLKSPVSLDAIHACINEKYSGNSEIIYQDIQETLDFLVDKRFCSVKYEE